MLVYSIDIGASSVKHALVDTNRAVGHITQYYSALPLKSRRFEDLQEQISQAVHEVLASQRSISTIAISTPGSVDDEGTVLGAGNFEGYANVAWERILKSQNRRIKRVVVVNDGKAAAWAEYMGQREERVINNFGHFVIGTGVGGATVVEGKMVRGEAGVAGLLGHLRVTDMETVRCSCGKVGCVETVASAPAIARYYSNHAPSQTEAVAFTFNDVVVAAKSGDEVALRAFATAGTYLGIAASMVMNIIGPGCITIGGGVVLAAKETTNVADANPYLDAVRASTQLYAHRRVVATTEIREARFGNDGGIVGAALVANSTDLRL